jgi:DNA mismatch repair protein MutL
MVRIIFFTAAGLLFLFPDAGRLHRARPQRARTAIGSAGPSEDRLRDASRGTTPIPTRLIDGGSGGYDSSLRPSPIDPFLSGVMSRIQQLSPHVINKIAAGEVIERPASVVKELLENSVDALSTRIDVDIGDGGSELIRVTDDGEGMHPDDLPLAVASHATSKLKDANDLFQVATLGFRGEALASIAEVSRFRIRSRQPDRPTGVEIDVTAGVQTPVRPCGSPAGTSIEVRDLFFNIPVRRKFLKQSSTEFGHISEQFTKIALANPRLHLVLRHNDRMVYELPAVESLLDRIRLFFGDELARQLIQVESEHDGIRVWGFVAHPSQSKATRKGQYLFLNGRWIQDRSLQHALGEAYRGLLMVGRNPVTFLFLEMPASLVDVNVHPTKAEVRFRDSQKLYRQLLSTIRTKFLGMDLNSNLSVPGTSGGLSSGGLSLQPVRPQVDPARQQQLREDLASWVKEQTSDWGKPGYEPVYAEPAFADPGAPPSSESAPPRPLPAGDAPPFGEPPRNNPASAGPAAFGESPPLPGPAGEYRLDGPHADSLPAAALPTAVAREAPRMPGDVRAMQIHDSYLIVETDEGLTVVDQHALHERVLYEQFRARVLAGTVEAQRLLVPLPVELTAAESALIQEHVEVLKQFGLELGEFGAGTVLVTAYPVLLSRTDPARIVRAIAEQITESGRDPARRDMLDQLLHMMACKGAIKAGQRLSAEEIDSLLSQRHLIDDAHHCPHGRPTALVLSRQELDRQFGRMG